LTRDDSPHAVVLRHLHSRLSYFDSAQYDIPRAPCQTERSRSLRAVWKEMKYYLIETAIDIDF